MKYVHVDVFIHFFLQQLLNDTIGNINIIMGLIETRVTSITLLAPPKLEVEPSVEALVEEVHLDNQQHTEETSDEQVLYISNHN